jgi:hypothetical protein
VDVRAAFEALYRNDLPRRLRIARSASADAESSMLTMLKAEYGSNFTHNLEPMFKDMKLARDEMVSYRSRLAEQGITPEIDLSVNVFSSGAWRTYPDVNVTVPDSIKKAIENFDKHYKTKHNDRKLTWKHNLAHCLLKAFFPRGDKEIIVSAFQAIVLLLFNNVPKNQPLSYTDIQVATSLSKTVSPLDSPTSTLHSSSPSPLNSPSLSTSHSPNSSLNALGDEELKRTLHSLACAKHRVLTKTPKGRDVSNTDTFAFNSGFYDPKCHIKINQIQTYERVAADSYYETQAAIARIMKSRKTIKHAELVSEMIRATKSRGVLDPADIKKNIEKYVVSFISKIGSPRIQFTNTCASFLSLQTDRKGLYGARGR